MKPQLSLILISVWLNMGEESERMGAMRNAKVWSKILKEKYKLGKPNLG
jgi:hypothetical protein